MFSLAELQIMEKALSGNGDREAIALREKIFNTIESYIHEIGDKKLFRFYWDCGRMGDLEGIFMATQEEVNNLIGKYVYFGEVLGKHSEIYGVIKEEDIELYSEDLCTIYNLKEGIGYNPFDYIEKEEEQEDE